MENLFNLIYKMLARAFKSIQTQCNNGSNINVMAINARRELLQQKLENKINLISLLHGSWNCLCFCLVCKWLLKKAVFCNNVGCCYGCHYNLQFSINVVAKLLQFKKLMAVIKFWCVYYGVVL